MKAMTGSLWVAVVDEQQRSVPGLQVEVRAPGFWTGNAVTAEDGLARFPEVPFCRAEVHAGGSSKLVMISIGRLVEVELQLSRQAEATS